MRRLLSYAPPLKTSRPVPVSLPNHYHDHHSAIIYIIISTRLSYLEFGVFEQMQDYIGIFYAGY